MGLQPFRQIIPLHLQKETLILEPRLHPLNLLPIGLVFTEFGEGVFLLEVGLAFPSIFEGVLGELVEVELEMAVLGVDIRQKVRFE
jgi:hypothetical protein